MPWTPTVRQAESQTARQLDSRQRIQIYPQLGRREWNLLPHMYVRACSIAAAAAAAPDASASASASGSALSAQGRQVAGHINQN